MATALKFIRLTFKIGDNDDMARKVRERAAKGGFDFAILNDTTVSFCVTRNYKGLTENGQSQFDQIYQLQKQYRII